MTQSLCDVCAVPDSEVEQVAINLEPRPRIVRLQPKTLDDVLDSIVVVAQAAGIKERGGRVAAELRERIRQISYRNDRQSPVRVALLEWLDPPFAAGHLTSPHE